MSIIDSLRGEIDRRERELKALRDALGVLEGSPSKGEFAGQAITEAATELLRERSPMMTRDIADALLARGIRTRSKDFAANVRATLSNSPEFLRVGKKWVLKEPRPEEMAHPAR
jgi:hypothetical protein